MKKNEYLTIPNILTCSRFLIAPILVLVASLGYRTAFLILLGVSLLTDVIDGYIARILKQTSELGAKLDGWADVVTWIASLICFFMLWPDLARREGPYAIFGLSAFILPMLIGFMKYRQFPSYHCWSAKFQAILVSGTVFLMLLKGISWPFRIAAILQGIAAIEDIGITLLLPTCHCDISSIGHAIKLSKKNT
ncbi:MAG: CDP-alcohol phosphatidyltransferase family protein [Candidatus Omnitrophica bacterium]|nr:CDP-alcohol phosphatidyltransferase family protein [Candidatus Omnitrophota bacterium]